MRSEKTLTTRRILGVVLGAILSGAVLVFLAGQVDWSEYARKLDDETLVELAACSLIYLGTLILRALRFRSLFHRLDLATPSVGEAFDLVVVNNILNHILPLRAGEVAFVTLAKVRHGIELLEVAAVLFIARIGDLTGLLLGLAVSSIFIDVDLWIKGLLCALAAIGAVFLWRLDGLAWLFEKLLQLLGGLLPQSISKKIEGVSKKVIAIGQRVRRARIGGINLGYSLVIWIVNNLFFWSILETLEIDLTFFEVFFGGSGAAILPSLPINMFGSLGSVEAGWSGGLMFVGASASDAVASGLIMHGVVIAISLVVVVPTSIRLLLSRASGGSRIEDQDS